MKRQRCLCLTVLAASILSLGSAAQAEEPLYLLFFGNSFSIGGSSTVPDLVGQLAVSDGHVAPVIVADLAGGQTLDYHLGQVQNCASNNVTNSALPDGETWDYVVMQGYSTEATSKLGSGEFDTDALALYNAVASSENGEGVTGILYQTWARWDLINSGYYSGDMDAMQDDIAAGYESAYDTITASGGSCGIATVGEAFGLLDYDDSLYGYDDYHASNAGYLLAAMVLYRTIYGEDVSDIAYDSSYGVSSSVWATLVATADAAPIVSTTPEPASLSLLGLGALTLLKRRRR